MSKQILTVDIAATFTEANVILLKEKLVARKKLHMIKEYRVLEYIHYGSMLQIFLWFLNAKLYI